MNGTFKRGEIYWIKRTGNNMGSEIEDGRPAVIVSNNKCNEFSSVLEVVYLTSQPKKDMPTHVTFNDYTTNLNKISTALCEQIHSVYTDRFGEYIGRISDSTMEKVDRALMISLGIEGHTRHEATIPERNTTYIIETLKKQLEEKEAELAKANKKADLFKDMADHFMEQIIENN